MEHLIVTLALTAKIKQVYLAYLGTPPVTKKNSFMSLTQPGSAQGRAEQSPVSGGGHERSVAEAARKEVPDAPESAEAFKFEWYV
jgi:hypothetical protein